jgi:hypothetical protein
VTPVRAPALTETSAALCFLFVLLIPSATAGLALINAGLGRFRNAAHSMLSALCVIAVAALVYFAVGRRGRAPLSSPHSPCAWPAGIGTGSARDDSSCAASNWEDGPP